MTLVEPGLLSWGPDALINAAYFFLGSLILFSEPAVLVEAPLWVPLPPRANTPQTFLFLLPVPVAAAVLHWLVWNSCYHHFREPHWNVFWHCHELTGGFPFFVSLIFPSQLLRHQMPLSSSPEFSSVWLSGSARGGEGPGVWPQQSFCKEIRVVVIWLEGKVCEICCEAAFGNRHTIFFGLSTYLRQLWERLKEILASEVYVPWGDHFVPLLNLCVSLFSGKSFFCLRTW